jgi:replicative superfamily II helicase
MRVRDLPAPPELVSAWERDMDELTAVQQAAVEAGILNGTVNTLVVAPTSSGKTLVGEMVAAQVAMTGQRYVFVAVPMKSLAEEHFFRLQERYRDLMNVVISTGDRLEYDDDIRHGHFDLAVLTYEKLAALVVQVPGLLSRCGCVVIDEGQMISDKHRGTGLEVLITQMLLSTAPPRLVVLSASLDDLHGLDQWLRAKAVINAERPVPLHQAVCSAQSGRALMLRAGGEPTEVEMVQPTGDPEALAVRLAVMHADIGQQVIVFRAAVPATRSLAQAIAAKRVATGIPQDLNERLLALEDPDIVRELADLLACGVAFHNADLAPEERRLIEDAFRAGDIRILISTTTLAMGVNMPADVVIVVDRERWLPGPGGTWTTEPVPVAEYRNSAGRAGRLNLRTEGVAILIAPDDVRRRQMFQHYVLGEVEPVESQIPKAPLHDVVFRLLAGRVAKTADALVEFVCATFAYRTFYDSNGGPEAVRKAVVEAVQAAIQSGLVVDRGGELLTTPMARALAGSGVGLESAIELKGIVDRLLEGDVLEADIVYELARRPESGVRPYAPRRTVHTRWDFRQDPHAESGALHAAISAFVLNEAELQALEQTACLLKWMDGEPARDLHRDFKMTRERLRTMGGNAAWLLQTLVAAAKVAGVEPSRVRFVRDLALRAQHGLPAELSSLATLRPIGVSREVLMELRQQGIVAPDDLLEADPASMQPALSPRLVQTFKEAIQRETAMSVRRKRTGHLRAAAEVGIPPALIEILYTASGTPLEEAVRDAFQTAGLAAKRVEKQPHGEEDIQVATAKGTIVVSATGSQEDQKPIKWTKAQEVMGQGAGLNPVNCICVGRPRFEALAERNATDIAREGGDRRILLVPVDVLVEAMIRCTRGDMMSEQFGDLLATQRGVLTADELPSPANGASPLGPDDRR